MRNLCFLLTLVATLLLPGRLIAAALPQDEKLITGQLDNGLRYMIYPHAHHKRIVELFDSRCAFHPFINAKDGRTYSNA